MAGSAAAETGGFVEKRPNWATVRGRRRARVNCWAETVRLKVAGSAERGVEPRLRRVGEKRGGKGGENRAFLFCETCSERVARVVPEARLIAIGEGHLLEACAFERPLWRLDLTVTSMAGRLPEHFRTQHLTYRQPDGGGVRLVFREADAVSYWHGENAP